MLTFKEFLLERLVDPVALASRVARRYSRKAYRSGSMKVAAKDHIPFSKVAHPSSIASAVSKYEKHGHKVTDAKTKFDIKDLYATQHHASIGDKDKLRSKISDTSPNHIHIITHKGKHFIADGHNAIMAAKLRGDSHIIANHTNLDSIK